MVKNSLHSWEKEKMLQCRKKIPAERWEGEKYPTNQVSSRKKPLSTRNNPLLSPAQKLNCQPLTTAFSLCFTSTTWTKDFKLVLYFLRESALSFFLSIYVPQDTNELETFKVPKPVPIGGFSSALLFAISVWVL